MSEVIASLIFGFILAISVGPIALIIIQNGILAGFKASGRSALGAALGDFTYAILAFTIGGMLFNYLVTYSKEIKYASSLVLLLFGLYLATSALLAKPLNEGGSVSRTVGLRATFALTIINPLTIIGFAAYIGQSAGSIGILKLLLMSLAVFAGSLCAQLIFAVGGAQLRRYLNNKGLVTAIKLISGLGVTGFAIVGFTT